MQLSLLQSIIRSRVASNTFYLMVLQALNNILPLLTIPYLVRVLGTESFGIISMAQVIAIYCNVVADYGFNLSATRLISLYKDDKQARENTFNAVVTLKAIILMACFILFTPVILFTSRFSAHQGVYFVSFMMAIGQTLFPVWYFQGKQNMRVITLLNGITKLLFTIPIFFLVKGQGDLMMVPLLNGIGAILAGGLGLYFAMKQDAIKYRFPQLTELRRQMKDGFDVFIPTFFSSILNNGGAFVLGMFHGETLVGFYMAIDKLVRAGLNLFYPLAQALFPSMAERLSNNKREAIVMILKVGGLVCGVIVIACIISYFTSSFWVTFIYGVEYQPYAYLLDLLMIWFLLGVMNNFIGVQFLVAGGYSALYRRAFLLAGIITLCMFVSIKYAGINGVVLSTIAGEGLLTLFMVVLIYKKRLIHS